MREVIILRSIGINRNQLNVSYLNWERRILERLHKVLRDSTVFSLQTFTSPVVRVLLPHAKMQDKQ